MFTSNEINERISFYENKILEYANKEKFKNRLDVSVNLLKFCKNQLVKKQKSNARQSKKSA